MQVKVSVCDLFQVIFIFMICFVLLLFKIYYLNLKQN